MGANRIYFNYFSHNPVYNDRLFRRRFRMRREVFLRVMDGVQKFDSYFEQKVDAVGKLGLSPIQKVTAAICSLRMVSVPMHVMNTSVLVNQLRQFVSIDFVMPLLGNSEPNTDVLLHQKTWNEFLVLMQLVDFVVYKDLSMSVIGGGISVQKHDRGNSRATRVHRLDWRLLWTVIFGFGMCILDRPGSLNDINICQRSTLLHDIINGQSHKVEFTVNGRIYNMPYFLVDGIYPQWYVFLKAVPDPVSNAETLFTTMHEAIRKDVERGFGVLQARWTMLKMPGRKWSLAKLSKIMHACIILHNMIIEDERHCHKLCQDMDFEMPMYELAKAAEVMVIDMSREIVDGSLAATAARMMATRDHSLGIQLRNDVIAHLWNNHSAMNKE